MRRHEKLIPLSREHHQFLVLAQVLRSDVAPYKGMPDTPEGKNEYLQSGKKQLLLKNIQYHRKKLYAVLAEDQPAFNKHLHHLDELENEIVYQLSEETLSEDDLHELGMQIQDLVRYRERVLYESIQENCPELLETLA